MDLLEAMRLGESTEPLCTFELGGKPRAWERAGVQIITPAGRGRCPTCHRGLGQPFAKFYDPHDQEDYKKALGWRAKSAMRGREPFAQALAVVVYAMMPIAKSWTAAEKDAAAVGTKQPTSTPDWDNLGKVVGDACNGIVWKDDAQIVRGLVVKEYGESPGLIVEVYEA